MATGREQQLWQGTEHRWGQGVGSYGVHLFVCITMIRIAVPLLNPSAFDSATDEVVTPEIGPFYTSRLDGASIVRIQGNADFSCALNLPLTSFT